MVISPKHLKGILDDARKWTREAINNPLDTLTPSQLDYRREFDQTTGRLTRKFGAEYDRIFGKKEKPPWEK